MIEWLISLFVAEPVAGPAFTPRVIPVRLDDWDWQCDLCLSWNRTDEIHCFGCGVIRPKFRSGDL